MEVVEISKLYLDDGRVIEGNIQNLEEFVLPSYNTEKGIKTINDKPLKIKTKSGLTEEIKIINIRNIEF